MNRDSLIDKIRKLRSLATSNNNINEAAAAAAMAEKLIQEHALAEAELEVVQGSTEVAAEDHIPLTDWSQRQVVWQNILLTTLSSAYDCVGVLKRTNGKIGYYAIGRATDITTLRYQYAFFTMELGRIAHLLAPKGLTRGGGKHWHASFYLGGVSAISESLRKVRTEVRAQASSSALMVIDRHMQEALALSKRLYPSLRNISHRSNIDHDAWALGHHVGSSLNTKPALGSGIKGLLKG